jgi:hypothetical protein
VPGYMLQAEISKKVSLLDMIEALLKQFYARLGRNFNKTFTI